jgi:pyruvate,water dikinase
MNNTRYTLYTAAEQPVNKQFLQMERNILDTDVIGCALKNSAVWNKGGYCQIFWGSEDIQKLNNEGKRLLSAEAAEKTLDEQRKTIKLYWESVNELKARLGDKNASQKQLGESYGLYAYALRRIYAHFITTTGPVTFAVESELRELLKKFGEQIEEVFNILTTPTEEDILFKELLDWKKILQNPSRENLLQHTKKYSILMANIFSEQEAVEWAQTRMKEKTTAHIDEEISKSQARRKELKLKQQEIFKELNSEKAEQLASFLRQGGLLRLLLKACWNGEAYHLLPFYEKVAEIAGCSVRDIYMFYTRDEISSLLHKNINMPKEDLEKRKKYCLLHYSGNKINIYNGKEALEMKKKILESSLPDKDIASFSGSIANKGVVAGQAKVLKVDNPTEIQRIAKTLNEHSILVTGMTNPTMMVLIQKVKGIITDEGGITCHAAIISREANLPCLVGCGKATIVLEDEDYILLDADNGIVRKITRDEFDKLKD